MVNTFTKSFYVSGNECSPSGEIHASNLQSKLMDCAFVHADELGFSRDDTAALTDGGVWVLIRFGAVLSKPLIYPTEFTVETYPTAIKGPYFGRDFRIILDGEQIGCASSLWLITNPQTGRLLRGKDIPNPGITSDMPHGVSLEKLKAPSELQHIDTHTVKFSDLDMNRHVNNTKYLNIAANALLQNGLSRISAWQINYIGECVAGEVIEIYAVHYDKSNIYLEGRVNDKKRFDMKVAVHA